MPPPWLWGFQRSWCPCSGLEWRRWAGHVRAAVYLGECMHIKHAGWRLISLDVRGLGFIGWLVEAFGLRRASGRGGPWLCRRILQRDDQHQEVLPPQVHIDIWPIPCKLASVLVPWLISGALVSDCCSLRVYYWWWVGFASVHHLNRLWGLI